MQHRIEIQSGAKYCTRRPYRAGPTGRATSHRSVDTMLRQGVIEPVQIKWSSPVLLVPKPDGSWRFCIDYRRHHAITVRGIYLIPRMNDCVDSFGVRTWFSSLDANSDYWQVSIAEVDRHKTTFTSQSMTYRFTCMPFGLTKGPATVQRTLEILFSGSNWRTFLVYVDDLLLFSKSFDALLKDVGMFVTTLQKVGVSVNLNKCCFSAASVVYLGRNMKPKAVTIDEARLKSFSQLCHPRNVTELRSFLGLCNRCRLFVLN